MGSLGKRKVVSMGISLAVAVAAAIVVLAGQVAGAHSPRVAKSVPLLSLPRGAFEISLGTAPSWLPLANRTETLTLIGGAPKQASSDNAYVAFTSPAKVCAPTPEKAGTTLYELADFYASAHSAARDAGAFAPNGGAAKSTYLASVGGVRFSESPTVRACVWLASTSDARSKKAKRSLAASLELPVLNDTFAASVSNLTAATPGSGGYSMYAFSADHAFSYAVSTTQCAKTSTDPASRVAAGTPASETVSISTSPCSGDVSDFTFSGRDTRSAALDYLVSDALASPPTTITTGGCELDPMTGATLVNAEAYLTAVGCKLGEIQVSPYEKTLPRGSVSWASVDGGVADIAPAKSPVDLVVNG